MKGVRTAIFLAFSTLLMLGGASTSALAHHDDARGSNIVYEGAGGK